MKTSPEEVNQRMKRLQEGLRRSGVKLTHQRLEIFRELAASGEHPDADVIYKSVRQRIPTVSLDTVYRTLWLLLDLGLITTLGSSGERTRFDANMKSHHHFVCSACGMTRDFYSEELDELNIPPSAKSFGRVQTAHVEVRGLCLDCIDKGKSKGKTSDKKETK
ncbi:MAG: transcriptional repressor [Sedimentisphaerales bacterium]|nr:transcriptional repressor [Sedimentisphaerales bacterium]